MIFENWRVTEARDSGVRVALMLHKRVWRRDEGQPENAEPPPGFRWCAVCMEWVGE